MERKERNNESTAELALKKIPHGEIRTLLTRALKNPDLRNETEKTILSLAELLPKIEKKETDEEQEEKNKIVLEKQRLMYEFRTQSISQTIAKKEDLYLFTEQFCVKHNIILCRSFDRAIGSVTMDDLLPLGSIFDESDFAIVKIGGREYGLFLESENGQFHGKICINHGGSRGWDTVSKDD